MLFVTIPANREVIGPLLILVLAMIPIDATFEARPWLGVDALWLSHPLVMAAMIAMALLLSPHSGWREGHVPPMDHHACRRHAAAGREPEGSVNAAA